MGRPKSEDPGILISFRIPKSLYAWWELESEAKGSSVSQLVKQDAVQSAKRGLAEIERGKGYARLAEKEADRETDEGLNKWCAATVPLHLTDELRMREAEASARVSEESPFKTRKPISYPLVAGPAPTAEDVAKRRAEKAADAANQRERAAIEAQKRADAKALATHTRNTLARKTVTPNFKKDKK